MEIHCYCITPMQTTTHSCINNKKTQQKCLRTTNTSSMKQKLKTLHIYERTGFLTDYVKKTQFQTMFKIEVFNALQTRVGPSKYISLKKTLQNATPN